MHMYTKEHGLICEKIKRNFILKYEEKKKISTHCRHACENMLHVVCDTDALRILDDGA